MSIVSGERVTQEQLRALDQEAAKRNQGLEKGEKGWTSREAVFAEGFLKDVPSVKARPARARQLKEPRKKPDAEAAEGEEG
jgi:hypothetical protein